MINEKTLIQKTIKVTLAMYSDIMKEPFNALLDQVNKEKLPYMYITFMHDDYRNSFITVVFQNKEPQEIFMTAPEDKFLEAATFVNNMNPGLNLTAGKVGYTNDDFAQNRVTAQLIPQKFVKESAL